LTLNNASDVPKAWNGQLRAMYLLHYTVNGYGNDQQGGREHPERFPGALQLWGYG
jgi:hypothetical protein